MEFPMEDGLLSMYRTGSDSDAGYGYGGSPSAIHSSSSSSSECIHTGSGTGTGPGAGSGSGSDSGLGFLQSLAQWIREHLGIATLSFNFLGAFRSLYLIVRSPWQSRGTQFYLSDRFNADVEYGSVNPDSAYPWERPDADLKHGSECGCDACTREYNLRRSGY